MRPTLVALLTLLAAPALASERPADLDKRIRAFEERTGIDLHLVGDKSETEARSGKGPQIGPVDPAKAAELLPVIEKVLLTYTEEVRGGLLTDLYLVGKLKMGGKPFLGAAYPKSQSFDLAIRTRSNGFKIRTTMHHEIAHLVEAAPFFPAETWKAFSAGGYVGREPNKQWREGEAGQNDALRKGFVSRYASKNHHEDFAEMAELAFTRPAKMREISELYPVVGDKLRLMTDVYRKVAPDLKLPWTKDVDRSAGRPPRD